MRASELRQGLRVEVEVQELDLAVTGDEPGTLAPPRDRRQEQIRRGQLDVESELVLQRGDRLEDAGRLGIELQIDVDRAGAPTFEQRFKRLVASILSLAAAGLGLLWALADEEKLTWHDHISRTFVTIDDTPGSAR